MIEINESFLELRAGYLFPEIGRRVRTFKQKHPQAKVISMGIGDVTQPLAPAVIEAMHRAAQALRGRHDFRSFETNLVNFDISTFDYYLLMSNNSSKFCLSISPKFIFWNSKRIYF